MTFLIELKKGLIPEVVHTNYKERLINEELDIPELYDSYYNENKKYPLPVIHSVRFIVGKLTETICYVGYFPIRALKDDELPFGLYFPQFHKEGSGKWVLVIYSEEAIEEQKKIAEEFLRNNCKKQSEQYDSSTQNEESESNDDSEITDTPLRNPNHDNAPTTPSDSPQQCQQREVIIDSVDILSSFSFIERKRVVVDETIIFYSQLKEKIMNVFSFDEETKFIIFGLVTQEGYMSMDVWSDELVYRRMKFTNTLKIYKK